MKKYLSVICSMLLVLFFVSCNKEDNPASQKITKLIFNIQVENASAPGTKVVKKDWETGDKVYAFFKVGSTHLDAAKYVILTYNGTTWDGALGGALTDANELGTAGTLYGVYFPFGNITIASDGANGVTFLDNGKPVYTYYMTGNAEYTITTSGSIGTLTCNPKLSLSIPDDYVWFFIDKDGSDYCEDGKYRLSASGIVPTACASFSAGAFAESSLNAGHTFWGYNYNDAGVAFSAKIDGTWSTAKNHNFMLYSGDDPTPLGKTFNKALTSLASVRLNMSTWNKRAYRGLEVSKGFLILNSDNTYGLTPGDDPFEIYDYYGKASSKNTFYFLFDFLKGDDQLGADGNNINANSPKLPSGWKMPSGSSDSSDWGKIIKSAPVQPITIQNADDSESTIGTDYYSKEKGYAFVLITKETKQCYGVLFLRDGSYIPKEGNIQYWGKGSNINNITYEQYLILEDAGCIFLPATGYFSTTFNSWRDREDEGHYVSCTHYSGSRGYHTRLLQSPSPQISPSTRSSAADYYPVRLVKAI
ncbi:MAG: hypothetical protein II159_02575 [Bacteroidales bacterium]|nr:hypothetical protein [Bacteroidales bacterium]